MNPIFFTYSSVIFFSRQLQTMRDCCVAISWPEGVLASCCHPCQKLEQTAAEREILKLEKAGSEVTQIFKHILLWLRYVGKNWRIYHRYPHSFRAHENGTSQTSVGMTRFSPFFRATSEDNWAQGAPDLARAAEEIGWLDSPEKNAIDP